MIYRHKTENITVELLKETATNKYGNKLRWIRLENGNTVSIWEKELEENFVKIS